MTTSTLTALINNAALLMALAVIYDVITFKLPGQKANLSKLIQGAVLGIIGVCILMISWEFVPGVIFDARSILLCTTGIFFGAIPTVTAVSIIG